MIGRMRKITRRFRSGTISRPYGRAPHSPWVAALGYSRSLCERRDIVLHHLMYVAAPAPGFDSASGIELAAALASLSRAISNFRAAPGSPRRAATAMSAVARRQDIVRRARPGRPRRMVDRVVLTRPFSFR